jgi:hypothetical protein
VKVIAENAKTLGGHGGDRTGEQGVIGTLSRGSNQSDYLTARIARDRPDVHDRMKAGEFASVRQAAIVAGIVKVPTPLDVLRRAWARASVGERQEFLKLIEAEEGIH